MEPVAGSWPATSAYATGVDFHEALNQIVARTQNVSVLRGYASDLNEARAA